MAVLAVLMTASLVPCYSPFVTIPPMISAIMKFQFSRVRVPVGAGNFSHYHGVQNGSGAHPASYPIGTRGSLLGGKAAGA
jgi:hypothetical protein